MKAIYILLSAVVLSSVSVVNRTLDADVKTLEKTVTFDGYEGGYFFFTDTKQKPLILVMDESTSPKGQQLIQNESIGVPFRVSFEVIKGEKDTTEEGVLKDIHSTH